jgi:hypothetical protein
MLTRIFQYKVSGYILIYCIGIMFIITLICSALLMYSYYNRLQIQEIIKKEKMILNLNSGINLLIGNPEFLKINEKTSISLYNGDYDSVDLKKDKWGIFDIISAKVKWNRFHYTKSALIGNYLPNDEKVALYLVEQNQPLSVCGNTRIKGKVYLPKLGIKSTFIEGKSYTGDKLIFSNQEKSSSVLPMQIQDINLLTNQVLRKKYTDPLNTQIAFIGNRINNTMDVSFNEITKVFFGYKELQLKNCSFSGNIVFVSDSIIKVKNNCILEDVLLIAPSIIIESGFNGSFQSFASDSILIGDNCKLKYPSVIAISNTLVDNINPCIFIGKQTSVNGIILNYMEKSNNQKEPYINIASKTLITGEIYCNGSVEHRGIVKGSICCNKFILQTPTSFYDNHLLDAVVDPNLMPVNFVGINFVSQIQKQGVVKWLY